MVGRWPSVVALMSPGNGSPDERGPTHVNLDLSIQKEAALYHVRVAARGVTWLDENFHLPRDSKVIDTLAVAIAQKALADGLTFFVSFE